MERPTFSQNWSRVSKLTPKMRPHVQITRQLFRGEPWHVVHDPVSNAFFRLNPVAYHFVGLLDGRRTVEAAWDCTVLRHGDSAPTQNEVIGLLGQLNQANLLRVDLPVDAQPLLDRARRRKIKHWTGQLMSILFIRIPLINPDRALAWTLPLVRPLLSRFGLMLWLVWMLFCAAQFLPELGSFARNADSVLAPSNWGWMILLFLVTKAVHEFGHGIVCKRFGGAVPETGVMMLVLFPAPFVDATSSWKFDDKWKRLLVGAAGMLFELPIAAGAALVWIYASEHSPGSLTQQLAYNTVFLASITTILFNANPLLRFDGYYMLSDLLEIPNLYDRASRHLKFLVQRYAFGMENAQPITTIPAEQVTMTLYGMASQVYRVLVLTGIILFIAGQFLAVGVLMAVWSFIAWVIIPSGKFVHWLATNHALEEHRPRAVAVTLAVVGSIVLLIGVIPLPEHRYTQGIVESAVRADVVAGTAGFVTAVHVRTGQHVQKDDVMFVMDNRHLVSRKQQLEAELQRLMVERRKALAEDPVALQVAEERAQPIRDELADITERLESLVIRSPLSGTVIGNDLHQLEGRYINRGDAVARVVDMSDVRVTSLVSQAQSSAGFFQSIEHVELRTVGQVDRVMNSTLLKAFDSGRNELPHPALGYGGGGTIATDQKDPKGRTTMRPQFELWFELPAEHDANPVAALLGQRVFVRFTLPKRPMLHQWIHHLHMVLREKLQF